MTHPNLILNQGKRWMVGDVREIPRLECHLFLNEDGRLVLTDRNKGMIWKSVMYKDPWGPHYATLEKGQLVIYRGTPDHPEVIVFETPSVSDTGTYKLGITISKKLVIFREIEGEERKTVWMSN